MFAYPTFTVYSEALVFEGCCAYLQQNIRAESRFYVRNTWGSINYWDHLYGGFVIYFRLEDV